MQGIRRVAPLYPVEEEDVQETNRPFENIPMETQCFCLLNLFVFSMILFVIYIFA